MVPHLAASPRMGGGEARGATVLQHHHNILHCHNITARWEVCAFVSRGCPQSPESEGKDQRRRERGCSVSDPAARWLSVEGDELCLRAARQSLRGLLLMLGLRLLLWTTRGSHLARREK